MTRARTRDFVLAAAALFALIQLIPAPRINPTVSQDMAAPPAITSVLERACYDCHSSRTRWPGYAHVAPVSWFLIRDVNRGRRHLNFSTWDKYEGDPGTAIHKLEQMRKETAAGTMPPWYYVAMHPDARLGRADRDALARWINVEIVRERKLEDSPQ
jgi:hypothetical protein